MDPSHHKSSDAETTSIIEGSSRQSTSDDQDEVESFDLAEATISDGFRPPQATTEPHSIPQQHPDLAGSSLDRPSSAKKSLRPHSLTLRHDGLDAESVPLPFTSTVDAPSIRPQSPYRGPSGPSYPYQMYPQRTLSNATSSTAAPAVRNSYDGSRGPTHPYALYTQSTVPTGDETSQQHHIPVGFSNAGQTYQRRLGPDGEEAGGLIGPFGHTEELPPYTRYPNQSVAPRIVDETNHNAGRPDTSALPQTIAGAGGIGVATRNPEFSATEEDLEPTQSCPSTASQHDINNAARDAAEKQPLNKWQLRAKRKLWGIVPYWTICLVIVAVILIGIILGAVIGTVFSHHSKDPDDGKGSDDNGNAAPASTLTVDVVPLLTLPANLAPLPTGSFGFPLLVASQAPDGCLTDANQSQTWSCSMPLRSYWMNISRNAEAQNTRNYDLTLTNMKAQKITNWGMQPPQITAPSQLTLVKDLFDGSHGPAWWLQTTYDKTVVLSIESLTQNAKRWELSESDMGFESVRQKRDPDAKPGDKCWICTWPDTQLEIFIYPNQNVKLLKPTNTTTTGKYKTYEKTPISTSAAVPTSSPTASSAVYPKAVKFMERRFPKPQDKAYCRQFLIIDNGWGVQNLTGSDDKPIEVDIILNPSNQKREAEEHTYYTQDDGSLSHDAFAFNKRSNELTQCGCLWWSQ